MTIETKWELGDTVAMKDHGSLKGKINGFWITRSAPTLQYEVEWADVHGVIRTRYFSESELAEVSN